MKIELTPTKNHAYAESVTASKLKSTSRLTRIKKLIMVRIEKVIMTALRQIKEKISVNLWVGNRI